VNPVVDRAKRLGIPVVDAENPIIVTVTKDDVVKAKKKDSTMCALSRASARLPGVRRGYFFRSMAYLEYANRMVRYVLPPSVQKEIVSFDRSQMFAEGAYQLSPCGNLRQRHRDRDRSGEIRRAKEKRQVAKSAKGPGDRRFLSGIERRRPKSPTILDQARDRTKKALEGGQPSQRTVRVTGQPPGSDRRSLRVSPKYVRDLRDLR